MESVKQKSLYFRCGEGKHPLLNTIKNGLLESDDNNIKDENRPLKPIHSYPEPSYPMPIDENDLDDIEVRPSHKPLKPVHTTSKPAYKPTRPVTEIEVIQTTKKPSSDSYVDERYKVVCYYTNWAWYR